jgi:glycosyltransferase involved in cell wall biosynthesis
MRVLLVIDGMHPRDGGPPRVVIGSAQALRARGLDVAVLTTLQLGDEGAVRTACEEMLCTGVELHFCAPFGASGLLIRRRPSKEIRAVIDQADVIHLHGLWSAMLVSVARYARSVAKPYLISTHGVLDHRAMWRTRFKWLKKRAVVELAGLRPLVRRAAGLIFGSEAEARESWNFVSAVKRIFIPNGVAAEVRRGTVSAQERALLAEIAPQFAGWGRSLLYFSRIHPEKGTDMLVKAFNAVASDFPDVGLLIAGIRQDEAFLAEVKALVEQGGHPDRIALTTELTGPRSQFLHSACDIFVLPSHAEGFSVAMIEALAHNMPCLVTQFCHAPLVESEGAGVIVSPTPEGIERGLRKLLSLTPEELTRMGCRARALFEAEYTWAVVAGKLHEAYLSAIAIEQGRLRHG